MSIGNSGRIVIEVDPRVKRRLYTALTREGMSLKEWFLKSAQAYLVSADQLPLSLSTERPSETERNIIDLRSSNEPGKT